MWSEGIPVRSPSNSERDELPISRNELRRNMRQSRGDRTPHCQRRTQAHTLSDRHEMSNDDSPRISVVIPAYRCRESIGDVLKALLGQTLRPAEIIVVDDCSPDGLHEALSPFHGDIVYLRNRVNSGLSKTYNHGLRSATGDYVMTVHSDCILEKDYLAKVYETLTAHGDVASVSGQYLFPDFGVMKLSDQLFCVLNLLPVTHNPSTSIDEIAFIEGKADLFHRKRIESIGFFDESLVLTAEDQDLSAKLRRLGYRLLQDNRARFTSKYNGTQDSLWKVLRKQFSYAQGQMYVLAKYPADAVRPTTANRNARAAHRLLQVAFASSVAGLVAIAFAWHPAAAIAAALIAARAASYLWLAKPMRLPTRLLAAPMGLVSDLLYTLGLCRGLLLYLFYGRA